MDGEADLSGVSNKRIEQKARSYNRLNAYAPLLIRNNVRHSRRMPWSPTIRRG
jgi:hypothetical protein